MYLARNYRVIRHKVRKDEHFHVRAFPSGIYQDRVEKIKCAGRMLLPTGRYFLLKAKTILSSVCRSAYTGGPMPHDPDRHVSPPDVYVEELDFLADHSNFYDDILNMVTLSLLLVKLKCGLHCIGEKIVNLYEANTSYRERELVNDMLKYINTHLRFTPLFVMCKMMVQCYGQIPDIIFCVDKPTVVTNTWKYNVPKVPDNLRRELIGMKIHFPLVVSSQSERVYSMNQVLTAQDSFLNHDAMSYNPELGHLYTENLRKLFLERSRAEMERRRKEDPIPHPSKRTYSQIANQIDVHRKLCPNGKDCKDPECPYGHVGIVLDEFNSESRTSSVVNIEEKQPTVEELLRKLNQANAIIGQYQRRNSPEFRGSPGRSRSSTRRNRNRSNNRKRSKNRSRGRRGRGGGYYRGGRAMRK
jgi:hypothetical protein